MIGILLFYLFGCQYSDEADAFDVFEPRNMTKAEKIIIISLYILTTIASIVLILLNEFQ